MKLICVTGILMTSPRNAEYIHIIVPTPILIDCIIVILPTNNNIRNKNSRYLKNKSKYDLILNCDSLTEINYDIAYSYMKQISTSKYFFSINHEKNSVSGATYGKICSKFYTK